MVDTQETHDYESGIAFLAGISGKNPSELESALSSSEIKVAITHVPFHQLRRMYNEKGLPGLAEYLEALALSTVQEEQRALVQEKESGPDWIRRCMERDLDDHGRYG